MSKALSPVKTLGQDLPLLVSSKPAIGGEPATALWRGSAENAQSWCAQVLAAHYAGKRLTLSLSTQGALAELSVTDEGSGEDAAAGGQSTAGDVRTPTLTLSMGTYARPIETITSPTDFTAIAPERVAGLRHAVAIGEEAVLKALSDATEKAYVKLFGMGITSRQDPCFSAIATRYIPLDKNFSATIGAPGEICAWSDVVSWLGNARAQYVNPNDKLKWRATGLTIAIRSGRWAEVSKTFEGAFWWPSDLYA